MNTIVNTKANLQDTVQEIVNVILANKPYPKLDYLNKSTVWETCRAVWIFVKNNIAYKLDEYGTEQIRTPERTWNDRKIGVDCEDYSIYVCSTLLSLGITPELRIVGDSKGFQHIYVIVHDKGETIIVDCCEDDFNKQESYKVILDVPVQKGSYVNVPRQGGFPLIRLSGLPNSTTPDQESILKYEGKGGEGKMLGSDPLILTQFFTPDWVIEMMWTLCQKHGFKGGKVLEPSCGSGRFMHYSPKNLKIEFTAFEREAELAQMAQRLVPNAKIYEDFFETAFLQENGGFYHPYPNQKATANKTWLPEMCLVIGNPPYGIFSGKYRRSFDLKGITQVEQFFMLQCLKTLRKDGLLCFITSSGFMNTMEKYNNVKEQMSELCTFLDAYRLPSGIFKKTAITADILIFKRK